MDWNGICRAKTETTPWTAKNDPNAIGLGAKMPSGADSGRVIWAWWMGRKCRFVAPRCCCYRRKVTSDDCDASGTRHCNGHSNSARRGGTLRPTGWLARRQESLTKPRRETAASLNYSTTRVYISLIYLLRAYL